MRLHRVGAKHQPSYRIVITPALSPRDGSYLDQVGFYDPLTEPATIRIDNEKAVTWLRKGVQPTDRVARLLSKVNIDPAAVRRGEPIPTAERKPVRRSRTKEASADAPAVEAATPVPEAAIVEPTSIEAPASEEAATKEVKPKTRSRRKAASPTDDQGQPAAEASVSDEAEKPVRKRVAKKTTKVEEQEA